STRRTLRFFFVLFFATLAVLAVKLFEPRSTRRTLRFFFVLFFATLAVLAVKLFEPRSTRRTLRLFYIVCSMGRFLQSVSDSLNSILDQLHIPVYQKAEFDILELKIGDELG